MVRHWYGLRRGVVKSLSPELFEKCGVVALRDVVSGHGGDGLGMDFVILVVFPTILIL